MHVSFFYICNHHQVLDTKALRGLQHPKHPCKTLSVRRWHICGVLWWTKIVSWFVLNISRSCRIYKIQHSQHLGFAERGKYNESLHQRPLLCCPSVTLTSWVHNFWKLRFRWWESCHKVANALLRTYSSPVWKGKHLYMRVNTCRPKPILRLKKSWRIGIIWWLTRAFQSQLGSHAESKSEVWNILMKKAYSQANIKRTS